MSGLTVTQDNTQTLYGTEDGDGERLLSKFTTWDKALDAHWDAWIQEGKQSFDMVAGRQWENEALEIMREQQRIPVVFNRMAPTIDAVCGAEIQGRQQVQYYPREVGDTAVNDVLTQGAAFFMEGCDGGEEDSDAFRDCLICGVGITDTRVEIEEGEVALVKERVNPLSVLFDPSSRRSNFADARYLRRTQVYSQEEFEELWPQATPVGDDELNAKRVTIVDPRLRYKNGELGDSNAIQEVVVHEYQWFEREAVHRVAIEGEIIELSQDQYDMARSEMPELDSMRDFRKVFYRAVVSGPEILEYGERLGFSYYAMTGKRDQTKGWWYGLVRGMTDPQRFANKYLSQMMHIINSNAKGGLMLEEGSAEDQQQFESSWADPGAVTWMPAGSLSGASGPKFALKPSPPYPLAADKMTEMSFNAIQGSTGVNNEMLGLADRQQPGVLEAQRKQAAYGILSAFFDANRRYLKMQGRYLLKLIQKYIPADELVRIVGEDGSPQYVPLALDPETAEYDVVVDDAPSGPNQKMQTFQILTQMMPLLQAADLPAKIWAEFARYSPLPASLAQKIAKGLEEAEAQSQQAEQQQAQVGEAAMQTDLQKTQSETKLNMAKAINEFAESQRAETEAVTGENL